VSLSRTTSAHVLGICSPTVDPADGHLLHFACHGLNGESEDLFFVARNIRWNRLGSTAFSTDFVRRRMQACVAGRNTHQERAGIAQCAAWPTVALRQLVTSQQPSPIN
jgi:hypothetical protein